MLRNLLSQRLNKRVYSINLNGVGRLKPHRIVINWGNSQQPEINYPRLILNHPRFVKNAINKLTTFNILKEASVSIPEFTVFKSIAIRWIQEGKTMVARTLLRASEGRGIVLANTEKQLPNAPLYVQYIKKNKEFRVHIFQNKVIDVQEKRRRRGNGSAPIRNTANGYVFCRDNIEEPTDLRSIALAAVQALRLDFGAVDIIWNRYYNKSYVLEVNTAPGIMGQTLNNYADNIIRAFYG